MKSTTIFRELAVIISLAVREVELSFKNKSDHTDSNLNTELHKRLKNKLIQCITRQDYEKGKILSRFIKLNMEFRYLTYLEVLKDLAGLDLSNIFYIPDDSTEFLNLFPGVNINRENLINNQIITIYENNINRILKSGS